jgi:hypothetical protein
MIPSPGNTRFCENRTAACDRALYDTGADVLLCNLNGKRMGTLVNTAGRHLHTIYTRLPSFLHTCPVGLLRERNLSTVTDATRQP